MQTQTLAYITMPSTEVHTVLSKIIRRSMCSRLLQIFAAVTISTHLANGQNTRITVNVPIRELKVDARATAVFANLFQVREIGNRQVLVNDGLRRQVILLDRELNVSRIVLDSMTSLGGERYGAVAAPLIAAPNDTSLFVDRESRALLVIDPQGKVIRTTASPTQPRDFYFLTMSRSSVDSRGNLVFRVPALPATKRIGDTTANKIVMEVKPPDSVPVLRASFITRRTDTVATLKQARGVRMLTTQDPPARRTTKAFVNPLETVDEWAMLSDGTVALVRGSDYHVDFVRSDGTHYSGAKLPFDWRPVSDAEKQHIIDSARTALDAVVSQAMTRGGVPAGNDALIGAMEALVLNISGAAPIAAQQQNTRTYSAAERAQPAVAYEVGPLDDIPDYYPPIRQGAAIGDADGNLWILPATSAQSENGELVYDVVTIRGELSERVRLPVGRSIVGFGPSGRVYLMSKSEGGWRLERAGR